MDTCRAGALPAEGADGLRVARLDDCVQTPSVSLAHVPQSAPQYSAALIRLLAAPASRIIRESPVVTTATKRATRASPDPLDRSHRRRIHTVSFDPTGDAWLDALLDLLTEAGYPKAGRSEIVRVGLLGLQEALAGRTRSEILTFFVLRDAERLLASFDGAPRLPFDWTLPHPRVRVPSDSPRRFLPRSVVPDSRALGRSVRLARVPSVLVRRPLLP